MTDTLYMFILTSRLPKLGLAIVATAALTAGCGGSSSHPASPATTTSTASSPTPSTKPARSGSATSVPRPTGASATTVAPAADLGALKQQLDAAGSSLGAAGAAIAQSDPNQTKNDEGTTP